MKNIVVLGSTGSIGTQTLDVVSAFRDRFQVVGLAAGHNRDLLRQQVEKFRPQHVWSINPLESLPPGVAVTPMEEMVCLPEVDLVMVATMGSVGLTPTLNALKQGKAVALSNKEPIVMAGNIIKNYEKEFGGRVLPVDSEPSAIWQCLQGENGSIQRLIITASGGPFRDSTPDELETVTPTQALRHPTWQMGKKITIDSATMMNKAFEVIESHWLFEVSWENIEVVIHPQSTVHSMVEFADGSVKAQLGPPNMRLPIQYAMFYPERLPNADIPKLPTGTSYSLDFGPLEQKQYPCFPMALAAAKKGGTYPTVLSAADEVAVNAFLQGRIRFTDICRVVEKVLSQHDAGEGQRVDELIEADRWATRRGPGGGGGVTAYGHRFNCNIHVRSDAIGVGSCPRAGPFFYCQSLWVKVLEFGVGYPPRAWGFYTGRTTVLLDQDTVLVNASGWGDLSRGQLVKVQSAEDANGNLVARVIEVPRKGRGAKGPQSLQESGRDLYLNHEGKIREVSGNSVVLADMLYSLNWAPLGGSCAWRGRTTPTSLRAWPTEGWAKGQLCWRRDLS